MPSQTPHNFSKSPVEEVFYSFIPGTGDIHLTHSFKGRYLGWAVIMDQITDKIDTLPHNTLISGCLLRYIDRIECAEGISPKDLIRITPDIPETFLEKLTKGPEINFEMRCSIPHSYAKIYYHQNLGKPDQLILIFEIVSSSEFRFNLNATKAWFDEAHAEIHHLFDQVVTKELINFLYKGYLRRDIKGI